MPLLTFLAEFYAPISFAVIGATKNHFIVSSISMLGYARDQMMRLKGKVSANSSFVSCNAHSTGVASPSAPPPSKSQSAG